MSEVNPTRANILGKLIRSARDQAGRSISECAQVLAKSNEEFASAEEGELNLSLPDLEVLSLYLRVPMSHFWGDKEASTESETNFRTYTSLRQRIVGVLLGHARIQSGRSIQDLADVLNVNADQIEAYESGQEAIPYFALEELANNLDIPMRYFTDEKQGPLAKRESELQMQRSFEQLTPEVKAFVLEPVNLTYLETAMRLSELEVEKLRSIAEGILEITL